MNKLIKIEFEVPYKKKIPMWSVWFDHGLHWDDNTQYYTRHVGSYTHKRLLIALATGMWKEFLCSLKESKDTWKKHFTGKK